MRRAVLVVVALLVGGCLGSSTASAPGSSLPPVGVDCPIPEAGGDLPSSRLQNLGVETVGGVDRLTFSFGPRGSEPGVGSGRLRSAGPPFVQGGSGKEVNVDGERHLEIRFEGVLVADESGNAVYQGPQELRPALPAVTHVVVIEQFEGVVTFIAGFRGRGCVALGGDPAARTVVVDIGHN